MGDRLYRSTTDRSIAGVAGGVAAWMDLDPSLVRVAWVVLALLSGGVFLLIYVVMAVVVPEAPPGWTPRRRPPAPGGSWTSSAAWTPDGTPGGTAPGGAWTGAQGGWTATAPPASTGGPASSWPEDWGRRTPPADDLRWRSDRAGVVVGILLVLLGAWLLVRDYVHINWELVWPVVVIVLGGLLIAGAMRRSR